jgi:hypothetical protein
MAFQGFIVFALANTVVDQILRLLIWLGTIPIQHHDTLQTLPQQQTLEKIDDIPIIWNLFETKGVTVFEKSRELCWKTVAQVAWLCSLFVFEDAPWTRWQVLPRQTATKEINENVGE